MKELVRADMGAAATIDANQGAVATVGFHNTYLFECFGADGKLKWAETIKNRVVNTGLDAILDKFYKGSAYTASFFVGLTDGAPLGDTQTDTLLSKAWAEVASYTEATRPALSLGVVASQSVDNSASKAVFNWTGAATIGGAFIAESGTKSETASLLVGVAAFAADRVVADGDTLNVTVTLTAANV